MQGNVLATPRGFYSGTFGQPPSSPLFEIQAGPTDHLNILEISGTIFQTAVASVAYVLGIGVPAAAGVGLGAGYSIGYDDSAATGRVPAAKLYADWTTVPTVPTNFLRRMTHNGSNTAGAGSCPFLFRFNRGYMMAANSSLVLWAISPSGNAGVLFTYFPNIVVDG